MKPGQKSNLLVTVDCRYPESMLMRRHPTWEYQFVAFRGFSESPLHDNGIQASEVQLIVHELAALSHIEDFAGEYFENLHLFLEEANSAGQKVLFVPPSIKGVVKPDLDSKTHTYDAVHTDLREMGIFFVDVVDKYEEFLARAQQTGWQIIFLGQPPYREKIEILDELIDIAYGHSSAFTLFIPASLNTRLQVEKLLELVKEYCRTLGLAYVDIRKQETSEGMFVRFYFDNTETGLATMQSIFANFGEFLTVCESAPEDAQRGLEQAGVAPDKASEITRMVSVEMRRLRNDLEHTETLRIAGIKHQMQEEIIEGSTPTRYDTAPRELSLTASQVASGAMALIYINNPTINIGSANEDKEIAGLREAISQLENQLEAATLNGALAEVLSPEVAPPEKASAKQKLLKFLRDCKTDLKDITTDVIAKYLAEKY